MFYVEKVGTAIVIAIGVFLVFVVAIFAFRPFFDQFDPAYRQAQAICNSIKVGMSYDELTKEYGGSFVPGPSTYVDSTGGGQVWLVNNVRSTQVSCNIQIEKGRVVSAEMVDEGSF